MNSPMQNLAALLTWMGSIIPWIASHAFIIAPAMLVSGAITFVQLRRLKLDPLKQKLFTGLMVFVLPLLAAIVVPKAFDERHDILTWIESSLIWIATQAAIIIPFGLLSGALTYFLARCPSADPGKQLLWALLLVVLMPTLFSILTPATLSDKYDHTITASVCSGTLAALNWLIRRNLPAATKQSGKTITANSQPRV